MNMNIFQDDKNVFMTCLCLIYLHRFSMNHMFYHFFQCSSYSSLGRLDSSCQSKSAQLLVQALVLSRLGYCNALLAGLPACTTKPLQLIQNAAARVVFNEPKIAHVTPLFIRLHWLPVAAHIKFKVLVCAYKTTTDAAPIYLNWLV